MALYSHIRCLLCASQNVASAQLKFALFYCRQVSNHEENESRTLSEFTSRLVDKKAKKWSQKPQAKRAKIHSLNTTYNKPPDNTLSASPEEINFLLKGAVESCDNLEIIKLARHCVKQNIFPPLVLLLQALSVCSQNGDKDSIIEIVQLCEKVRPEILEKNSHFQHYMAEAIWIKGNVGKSLDIFEQVYSENPFLRQRIRLMLKCLISDSITNRSEATLVSLVKFSKTLAENYSDLYPLVCIWEAAFLSEWFLDQCLAVDLIDKNKNLLEVIENRIPYVVHISLRSHRTEVVYRLTDILLKYHRKSQAAQIFFVLMDYWIKQGALKRCLEIVQWSLQNDVKLPAIYQMNFINLLTKGKTDCKPAKKSDRDKLQTTNYRF